MVTTSMQRGGREELLAAELLRQQSLPPSDRDFEVYDWLVCRGDSTRGAARQFGLSQTRVMQIRQRVVEWVDRCAPPSIPLSPERRVQLAANMAFEQLDFLYAQATECFRLSQGARRTTRTTPSGDTIVTESESIGDLRCIDLASRLTDRKLAMAIRVSRALGLGDRDAEAGEGKAGAAEAAMRAAWEGQVLAEPCLQAADGSRIHLHDSQRVDVDWSREARYPLDRDCSPNVPQPASASDKASDNPSATACEAETCEELEQRRRAFLAALRDDTAPVHPPFTDAGGMLLDSSQPQSVELSGLRANGNTALLDEPAVAPGGHSALLDEPAVAPVGHSALLDEPVAAPLSRKERRKRQRLLARKQRKAK